MKTLAIVLALLTSGALSAGDGHLYVSEEGGWVTRTVEGGVFEMRFPTIKVPITHAILRHDTDDPKILWLELHMTKLRDPGDWHYFEAAEEANRQLYFRGSAYHEKGCKWAMRFDNADKARRVLRDVGKAYTLDSKHLLDKTGEQGGAGQPATRSESK